MASKDIDYSGDQKNPLAETANGSDPTPQIVDAVDVFDEQDVSAAGVLSASSDSINQNLGIQSTALSTDVDIVFVIDATGSMGPFLDKVKDNAKNFYANLEKALEKKKRRVHEVRLKVITYRDYFFDPEPMKESRFFKLPEDSEEFKRYVDNIEATGGEDEPESALEALYFAMHSTWQTAKQTVQRRRQIIILLTDASAHALDDARRFEDSLHQYPSEVPTSIVNLQAEWVNSQGCMDQRAKRLAIFAPNTFPWNEMSSWNLTTYTPSKAGDGLSEVDMEPIYMYIAGSI